MLGVIITMSKRCKMVVYGVLGCIGALVAGLLIKLIFFSGLFIPQITLNGDHSVEVEVGTNYKDEGANARFRFQDYNDQIVVKSDVDTKKLGTYHITYTFEKYDKKVKREVKVVDTKAPKIKLKGKKLMRIFENAKFVDPGVEAIDNNDGDVTSQVIQKGKVDTTHTGTYNISYQVTDSSGNSSKVTRKVKVYEDPTNTKVYYNHDDYDNKAEEWWFNKSKNHERTTGCREEGFLAQYDSFFMGPDEKVIYLTFDEGGNDITYIKEIADVLNKNDVKATFFLTRNYIKNEADFMNDLVKHGHLIANHTWHHYDMPLLANAQSIDSFVKEITETEKTYMEVTGQQMKKVFRFPKGGMSERSLKIMRDLGYKTFFWSHAYYDFAQDVSKEEALKTLEDHYHNGAIYLLHPSNKGNYEAMDEFIKYMKDQGYRFDTVEDIGQ